MATLEKTLALNKIKPNPDNPRFIKDVNFKKLVQSLKDFPVMTEKREVLLDENNIILGGNMRYRAAKEAGWKEINVKFFTREDAERNNKLTKQNKTYEDYRNELIIKDNASLGERNWEEIANEWSDLPLDDWGIELPLPFGPEFKDKLTDDELKTKDKAICPNCGLEFTP